MGNLQSRVRGLKSRLTWHDPLADQLLSGSSLLEFELEDCMETGEVRGRRGEKRESVTAGWSPEVLRLPDGLLLAPDQWSTYYAHTHNRAQGLGRAASYTTRTCNL